MRLSPRLIELESRLVPGVLTAQALVSSSGPGMGSVSLVNLDSPAPNNDNASTKVNFASFDLNYANRNYIDRVIDVQNSNGTSEYWMEDQVSNSGPGWIGFEFDLGFGTGEDFRMRGSPALDMDWPDRDPTPKNFTTYTFRDLAHSQYSIRWLDGQVSTNGNVSFYYDIDVPDFDSVNMPPSAQTANGYRFTIRAYPLPIAGQARPQERPGSLDGSVDIAHPKELGEVNLGARPQQEYSRTGQNTLGIGALPLIVSPSKGADELLAPVLVSSPALKNQFQRMDFGLMATDLSVAEDPLFVNSTTHRYWSRGRG